MISRSVAILFVLLKLVTFASSAHGESLISSSFSVNGKYQTFKVDTSRKAIPLSLKTKPKIISQDQSLTGGDEDYGLLGVELVRRADGEKNFGRGLPVRFSSGGVGLLTDAILIGVDDINRIKSILPQVIMAERLIGSLDVYRVRFHSPEAVLRSLALLQSEKSLRFVHPDFRLPVESRGSSDPTEEPLWSVAWHLKKTDVSQAWVKTTGSSSVLVALIDLGFEVDHPDLQGAWAVNPGEIPGNRKDDDSNGLVDDVLGWNFGVGGPNLLYGAGPGHGTATAGIIAARVNGIGGSGICPGCRVLPLVIDDQVSSAVAAFYYAKSQGAAVVSNSWGYRVGTPETEALSEAIQKIAVDGRGGQGTSVVFAMGNKGRDDCRGSEPDISALPSVIAVSSADFQDKKIAEAGYGECLAILAPSSVGRTQGVVTTDRRGKKGFNSGSERGDLADLDYTNSFHGTSAAAPQVAGALALLYSLCPSMEARVAYDLLISSADKVNPDEARYDSITGRSLLYGYGRLNIGATIEKAANGLSSQLCPVPKDEEHSTDQA
jgi:subtilisin family serine protease